jgi:hypothetical protein
MFGACMFACVMMLMYVHIYTHTHTDMCEFFGLEMFDKQIRSTKHQINSLDAPNIKSRNCVPLQVLQKNKLMIKDSTEKLKLEKALAADEGSKMDQAVKVAFPPTLRNLNPARSK